MKARYNIIIAAIACLFLSFGEIQAQDTPQKDSVFLDNAQSYFIKAQGAYILGNVDSAYLYVKKSLELDKSNDAAWSLVSKIAFKKGDFAEMMEGCAKAYEIDPDNLEYAIAYAQNLVGRKRVPESLAVLEKAWAANPKNEEVATLLAQIYASTGNFSKAEEVATEFKNKAGETHMAYYLLYNVYAAQQKSEQTLKVLLEADEKIPNPVWKELIADEYLKSANDSLAEVYYNKALAENPSSPAALFGKMEIERTSGDIGNYINHLDMYLANKDIDNDKKLNYLQDVLKSPYFFDNHTAEFAGSLTRFSEEFPADTAVGYLAAQFNMVAKEEEKSGEILKRLLQHYPSDKGVAVIYISYQYTIKGWQEIKAFCQNHLKANDIPQLKKLFLQTQASAEYFLNDYTGALKTYTEIEKFAKAENDTNLLIEAYATKGDLLHTMGKRNECFKYYKKALAIDPEYCPVLNNYAWYLATDPKSKDFDKAQQMSKITIQKEPGNSTYLDTYAYILYKRGNLEEAKKYYQQAVAFGTDLSSTIYRHYAQCLYALGEYDLAKKQYLNALNAAVSENDTEVINSLEKEIEERNQNLKLLQNK